MQNLILPGLVQVVLRQGFEPVVRLRVLWSALVGKRLAKVSAPQGLFDGQLYVQAQTAEVAAQLQAKAQEILAQIEGQGVLPELPGVSKAGMRVVVSAGTGAATRTGRTSGERAVSAANRSAEPRLRRAPQPLPDRLHGALADVEDPALRAQLERLLRQDLERRVDEEGVDLRGAR
jgi:predicted nucleic acid-binding Zn ribbon protein